MIKLRPYQADIFRAVFDSITHRKGLTFSVEMARQGGKNELSAQIEVLLLTLFMAEGGDAIKCSPTFKPQTVISMQRLKDRLNDWGYDGFWSSEHGYIIKLGEAREIFLSADISAEVVGHTAHLLLEIDEAQDVAKEKYTKDFKPMGATTNVTTIHYGTTWDDSTLLEEVKQTNLELQKKDGIRRHFHYDWQDIAKFNPDYQHYVEAERQRLGENHPLFLTQYALVPLHGGGRFFTPAQRAQLQGDHPRLPNRDFVHPKIIVAGIDLAGEAEEQEDIMVRAITPRRDSTVITIGEVILPEDTPTTKEPALKVLEHYSWTGIKHADLYPTMVDLLQNTWKCNRIAIDSTGIGEPVASFMRKALGRRVVPFNFSQRSKSELGFELLSFVNSSRLKMYAADGSPEYQEFWLQMEKAKSVFRPSQTMNFFVAPEEGHDDYLMSLALACHAAAGFTPRIAKGR